MRRPNFESLANNPGFQYPHPRCLLLSLFLFYSSSLRSYIVYKPRKLPRSQNRYLFKYKSTGNNAFIRISHVHSHVKTVRVIAPCPRDNSMSPVVDIRNNTTRTRVHLSTWNETTSKDDDDDDDDGIPWRDAVLILISWKEKTEESIIRWVYLLCTAARHRSRRVDNVDPLSRMLPTYMLVHVSSLLAARAAVRAFEPRRYAALVTQMALQTLHHGVTVPTLWTHVIFFLASSPSKRSVDVPDPRSLIFPRLLIRIGSVIPVYQAKRTIHWKQNKRDG